MLVCIESDNEPSYPALIIWAHNWLQLSCRANIDKCLGVMSCWAHTSVAWQSFQSDASDSNGESCAPSPSYPFDTASRGSASENSRPTIGGRATDAARVARFKKILAAPTVDVGKSLHLCFSQFRWFGLNTGIQYLSLAIRNVEAGRRIITLWLICVIYSERTVMAMVAILYYIIAVSLIYCAGNRCLARACMEWCTSLPQTSSLAAPSGVFLSTFTLLEPCFHSCVKGLHCQIWCLEKTCNSRILQESYWHPKIAGLFITKSRKKGRSSS